MFSRASPDRLYLPQGSSLHLPYAFSPHPQAQSGVLFFETTPVESAEVLAPAQCMAAGTGCPLKLGWLAVLPGRRPSYMILSGLIHVKQQHSTLLDSVCALHDFLNLRACSQT